MTSLKNSFALLMLVILTGCTSSSYTVDSEDEGRTQLAATPDRVILECEPISDYSGDIKNAHGFMMHVLDETNTALTIHQGNVLGKSDCFRRINKIRKILKNGTKIFIGGMGSLNKSRQTFERKYLFPGRGQFPDNGRVLQFMVIWNDKGICYNAYSGDQKPCPSDEFPIVK